MKRVLIVDYHFPPVNNINARRFGEMAPYMPDFGWEPIVLTTNSQGSLPVKIPKENIIRLGKNYYDEEKIITSDLGFKKIPLTLKIPYFFYKNLGIEMRSIDRFLFDWGREVMRQKEMIKGKKFDIIVASSYPPVALWLGRFLSKEAKKPWIADLHDPLSLWNNSRFPLVKFLDKRIDKFLIKTASAIITLGSHLASKMEEIYNRPIEIIYNGFDRIDGIEIENKNIQKKEKEFTLYYAGRFHAHRMPAVKLLIDWLAQEKRDNFYFVLRSLGPKEANEEIIKYAKEKNAIGKINLLPPVKPEIIFQEERDASVLVLFEDLKKMMRNSEGTLPGKLMEYLQFRAPILAINRSDSEIGKILEETSRGYLVSNFGQLEKTMENILNDHSINFEWEKVKTYSRFSQCQKFCQILDKVYQYV